MSWRLLKSCGIILFVMSVASVAAAVLSGLTGMSIVLPSLLAGSTALAGVIFWKLGKEQQEVMKVIRTAMEDDGIPEDLIDGLTRGSLTEEQFEDLVNWTERQAQGDA